MKEVWSFEHSVHCAVSPEFAWTFWTNVGNWTLDADVEAVELHGPFESGSKGVTRSKSSGQIEWYIAEAKPTRAVLEFPVAGAIGRFFWYFEGAGGKTKITQRASLSGERAHEYATTFWPKPGSGNSTGHEETLRRNGSGRLEPAKPLQHIQQRG